MKDELTPDRTISHYRIISHLGAGGMGEVYLGEDTRLKRKVALKLLPAELTESRDRLQRFEQEASAASALNHPNIITIYEIGEADQRCFIATEFIDGRTLRQEIARGRMTLSKALDIAIQVAGALDSAHAAGIIHRDIKPDNIRRDGYVKVLDFGLAKLTEPTRRIHETDSKAATRVLVKTDPGMVMGTAHYMSPEQARGLPIDARTDIWSLGVVMYEMVAGRIPFEGATPTDVIVSVTQNEPPPLARYANDFPSELEWIIAKALRKERDERYQTAREMATDLKRLKQRLQFEAELERSAVPNLSSEEPAGSRASTGTSAVPSGSSAPTSAAAAAAPTSSAEYLVREIRSHKRGAIAVLGIFAVAFMTAAYFLFLPRRAGAIESIAVLPLVNASGDANADYLSDGISESLINNLTQVPKLRVLARSTVFRYKGKEVDPQKVGRELGVRAVLTGRVQQRGDNLVIQADLIDVDNGSELWGEQYNRSISDLLAVQQDIAREITTKLRLKLSGEEEKQLTRRDAANTEAYHLYLKGRFYWNKRTEESLKQGLEYFNQAIAKDPNYALAYVGLADSYTVLGDAEFIAPGEAFPKAKAAAMKALEIDDKLGEAHASLGLSLMSDWDWPGVEREYKRAIEVNPSYASVHQWYGIYLSNKGQFDEALAEMKRAQELEPLSLNINNNLAYQFSFKRQYDEAIQQFRKTLELDPNFARAHTGLGRVYVQEGRFEEAIAELQKAVSLSGQPEPVLKAVLGHTYAISGKRDEARKVLDEMVELSKRRYVSAYAIAMVYAGLGEKEQAFASLEKAYGERAGRLQYLRADREWDSLRSDSRFADLLRRIRL